jgi:hypothetical protein
VREGRGGFRIITMPEQLADKGLKIRQLRNALKRALKHVPRDTHPALISWSKIILKNTEGV